MGTHQPSPLQNLQSSSREVALTLEFLFLHRMAENSTSKFKFALITLDPRPECSWHFCTDNSKLSSITFSAKYALPSIEDCLDQLQGGQYFLKLDVRFGHWQVQIAKEDIDSTAFRTQEGHH